MRESTELTAEQMWLHAELHCLSSKQKNHVDDKHESPLRHSVINISTVKTLRTGGLEDFSLRDPHVPGLSEPGKYP